MVLSIPFVHSPPSKIISKSLSKYSFTCWAVVLLIVVNGFALGAANGKFNCCKSANAIGWLGIRTATVGLSAVTILGTSALLSNKSVKGPGQKCWANKRAFAGMFCATTSK